MGFPSPHLSSLLLRRLAQVFLLSTCFSSLLLCPYSKVEESFQLQATHDLFYFGLTPAIDAFKDRSTALPYDHLQYPGVVPRTFTGPLLLSALCQGVRLMILPFKVNLEEHPNVVQFLARFFLMAFNLHAWFRFASALDKTLRSRIIGSYLLLVTACQFHLPFYSSRMLPNTFATVLALHAFTEWILDRIPRAAVVLVAAMTVVRCDLVLLLAVVGLTWLVQRKLSIPGAIRIGLITMTLSLSITVPLESLLWQKWVWPEGVVLYYNTVLGKSSDWGVSPWNWYWLSALPKALLGTALLVPLSVVRLPELLVMWERKLHRGEKLSVAPSLLDTEWFPFLLPALGFVAFFSCLGHKEMRFLFPVLPLFNLVAAAGFARIHSTRFPAKNKPVPLVGRALFLAAVGVLVVSFAGSSTFVAVSRWNYPGGDALRQLSSLLQNAGYEEAVVHIDVATAMSGVSRFAERAAQSSTPGTSWSFEKAGYEEENMKLEDRKYTHMLSESSRRPGYRVIGVVQGKPRLIVRTVSVATEDAIYILERDGDESLGKDT